MGPIVKIELEGIRAQVLHHLQIHHSDMNEAIRNTLESTLTEGWVETEIKKAVDKTVREAIDGIADNFEFRQAVSKALGSVLAKMVNEQ